MMLASLPSRPSSSRGPITGAPRLPAGSVTPPLSSNRKVPPSGTLRPAGGLWWRRSWGGGAGADDAVRVQVFHAGRAVTYKKKNPPISASKVSATRESVPECVRGGEPRCRNGPAREYRNAEQLNYRCRSVVIEGGAKWCKRTGAQRFLGPGNGGGGCFWGAMR